MAIASRTIRGLQDIQTHSGKVREAVVPHKAYMKLSCLEMEKFRRTQERESAMSRVRNIDARFLAIEAEKAVIENALNEQMARDPGRTQSTERPGDCSPRAKSGFRLKY